MAMAQNQKQHVGIFPRKRNIYLYVYVQALLIFHKINAALGVIPTSLSQRQGQAGICSA